MTAVRASPPRASRSSNVSLLSRYGTCLLEVERAEITLPNAESDLLMQHASRSLAPDAHFASFCRSLPARSTMCKQVVRCRRIPSSPRASKSAVRRSVKTAWDREDSAFVEVPAVVRLAQPLEISLMASSTE